MPHQVVRDLGPIREKQRTCQGGEPPALTAARSGGVREAQSRKKRANAQPLRRRRFSNGNRSTKCHLRITKRTRSLVDRPLLSRGLAQAYLSDDDPGDLQEICHEDSGY